MFCPISLLGLLGCDPGTEPPPVSVTPPEPVVSPEVLGTIPHYSLRFVDAENHLLEVEAVLQTDGAQELPLMMAVWTPGSYLVREFARHVEAVEAGDDLFRRIMQGEAPAHVRLTWL